MTEALIHPAQIQIGQPLPHDAFDRRGMLLLRRGHVVATAWQMEVLLQNAVLAEGKPPAQHEPVPVAQETALSLVLSARLLLRALLTTPPREGFADEALGVVDMLARACRANADVALATILMHREDEYSIRHSVNAALACEVVGSAIGMPRAQLAVTVAAALTMNIGMLALQDNLQSHVGPLDDTQRADVRGHCERGAALLIERGVEDPVWLATVRDHHERPDGSGYPAGKSGDALALPARLVGLADVYCARVSSRETRPAMAPNAAMRQLFLREGATTDETLARQLIKALGIYPPGTGVRLRNGRIALVIERGMTGHKPLLALLTTGNGARLQVPLRRTSDGDAYAIIEVVDLAALQLEPMMDAVWGGDAVA